MELKEATKQLNKTKEIFEHLKYHGWINAIKRDVDASDVIEAIDTVLAELDKQKQVKAEMRKVAWEEGYNQGYFTDVGKMAEKIEELDVKCLSGIFIANDAFNKMVAFSTTLHKLNEVINKVNAQTTVLLTQNDKDYDEAVKALMNN